MMKKEEKSLVMNHLHKFARSGSYAERRARKAMWERMDSLGINAMDEFNRLETKVTEETVELRDVSEEENRGTESNCSSESEFDVKKKKPPTPGLESVEGDIDEKNEQSEKKKKRRRPEPIDLDAKRNTETC